MVHFSKMPVLMFFLYLSCFLFLMLCHTFWHMSVVSKEKELKNFLEKSSLWFV